MRALGAAAFALLFWESAAASEANLVSVSTVAMPAGLTVSLGMPLREFLVGRTGLESDTPLPFPSERPADWKDPSNPASPDFSAERHSFTGLLRAHPTYRNVRYGFHHGILTAITLDTEIPDFTRLPEARRQVIGEAVRLWGPPNKLDAEVYYEARPAPRDRVKRRAYWAAKLIWTRENTTVYLVVPENLEEGAFSHIHPDDKAFGPAGAGLLLVIQPTSHFKSAVRDLAAVQEANKRAGLTPRPTITPDEYQSLYRNIQWDQILRDMQTGLPIERKP